MKPAKKRIIFYLVIFLLVLSVFFYQRSIFLSDLAKSNKKQIKPNQTAKIKEEIKPAQATGAVSLFLDPSSGNIQADADFPVTLKLDAGAGNANIISINLSFDQGLTVKPEGCIVDSNFISPPGKISCSVDEAGGTVHLALQASGAAGPSGVSSLAIITFTPTSTGTKNIRFTGTQQVYIQQADGITISAAVSTTDGSYQS